MSIRNASVVAILLATAPIAAATGRREPASSTQRSPSSSPAGSIAARTAEASSAEIARSVSDAANGTRVVSRETAEVTDLAGRTGVAAGEFLLAAGSLNHEATVLREEVERFVSEVRAS